MARSTSKPKRATKRAVKSAALAVAVVMSTTRPSMGRPAGGDWASFVDPDPEKAIGAALTARDKWGRSRYEILVGTLTAIVDQPVAFRLVPLT